MNPHLLTDIETIFRLVILSVGEKITFFLLIEIMTYKCYIPIGLNYHFCVDNSQI